MAVASSAADSTAVTRSFVTRPDDDVLYAVESKRGGEGLEVVAATRLPSPIRRIGTDDTRVYAGHRPGGGGTGNGQLHRLPAGRHPGAADHRLSCGPAGSATVGAAVGYGARAAPGVSDLRRNPVGGQRRQTASVTRRQWWSMSQTPAAITVDDDIDWLTEQIEALKELGRQEQVSDGEKYDFSIRWGTALAGRLPRLVHYSSRGLLDEPTRTRFQALCDDLRGLSDLIDRTRARPAGVQRCAADRDSAPWGAEASHVAARASVWSRVRKSFSRQSDCRALTALRVAARQSATRYASSSLVEEKETEVERMADVEISPVTLRKCPPFAATCS